jgi:hypothetical protein
VHFGFKKLAKTLDDYFLNFPYREDEARDILVQQVRSGTALPTVKRL